MTDVLYNIANLLSRSDGVSVPQEVGVTVLRGEDSASDLVCIELPMFAAFSRLARKLQAGVVDETNKKYLQSYFRAYHYNENIRALLSLIIDARDSTPKDAIRRDVGVRIALDIEKLV